MDMHWRKGKSLKKKKKKNNPATKKGKGKGGERERMGWDGMYASCWLVYGMGWDGMGWDGMDV
jgi:hypothetical protein